MPAAALFLQLLEHWKWIAAIIVLGALGRLLVDPAFHQWLGKSLVVRLALRHLDPRLYRVYHDLHLPLPRNRGTIPIDHVVVSPFGVFVIESISLRGFIYGTPKQALWTQITHRRHRRFDNPLPQHHYHVCALIDFLEVPEEFLHSALLFVGWPEFKTPMPDHVLNRGLIPWIQRHTIPLLNPRAMQRVTSRLDELSHASPLHTGGRQQNVPVLIRRTG